MHLHDVNINEVNVAYIFSCFPHDDKESMVENIGCPSFHNLQALTRPPLASFVVLDELRILIYYWYTHFEYVMHDRLLLLKITSIMLIMRSMAIMVNISTIYHGGPMQIIIK